MVETNLSREESRIRAQLISECGYDVRLDLTGTETFRSETRLRFRASEPGAATFVNLVANRVDSATLNGRDLPAGAFDRESSRLTVPGLEGDNELVVVADCAYEHTGVGLHRFVDPVDGAVYLHTQFEPFDAHRVFAAFDQPDLKAAFRFEIDAPAGWDVVSNARVVQRPADGAAGVWRFAPTETMSTYLAAIVAGPYHSQHGRHRDVDFGLYCRQSLAEYLDAEEIFEITGAGFDFFEEAFGCAYPFGKYDQLFVPEFNFGAMENAGCVTFSERHLFRSKVTEAERMARADTILHELAHMWFGDLVTMRWWDDLWLNESFATFASNLGLVSATRFRSAWTAFASNWKTWAYRQDQLPSTHPIVADASDIAAMKTNFDGITYAKGASVLRQLVAWVGQDQFLSGVRSYFARHAWGNTDLSDFLGALEDSSGRDLSSWASEWLSEAGVNTLRTRFAVGQDGTFTSFAIEQEAPADHPTLRSHRIGVGLYDHEPVANHLTLRERIELDVVGPRTEVPALVGKRAADLVLLNDGDLAYTKIRLDDASLETLGRSLGGLSDGLARGLCWAAAWDMLRDAELPAGRYLDLVLENVDREDEIAVVGVLLRNAEAAAVTFGHPANRDAHRQRVAGYAREAMYRALPGSDVQLAYARAFASTARRAEDLRLLERLLDGAEEVKGLALDTEFRWHVVRCLAGAGAADERRIAAESERDATDAGARHAAAARAARPSADAKAAAWAELVDGDLPMATMRAVMGGFRQPAQEDVLRAWVQPYFDALQGVWDRRGAEVSMSFTEMMFPAAEGAVEGAEAYLASGDVPSPVRRLLLEGRDDALRVARARACDAPAG